MAGFLQRIAKALFKRIEPTDVDLDATTPTKQDASFGPIDSNVTTARWFDPKLDGAAARDSIDSNPDTARWYRRRRFVVPGAAVHRTSDVGGGQ